MASSYSRYFVSLSGFLHNSLRRVKSFCKLTTTAQVVDGGGHDLGVSNATISHSNEVAIKIAATLHKSLQIRDVRLIQFLHDCQLAIYKHGGFVLSICILYGFVNIFSSYLNTSLTSKLMMDFSSLSFEELDNNLIDNNLGEDIDKPSSIEVKVVSRDTLLKILTKNDIVLSEVNAVLASLQKAGIKHKLRVGQNIILDFDFVDEDEIDIVSNTLKQITIVVDKINKIVITKQEDNNYIAKYITVPLIKKVAKYHTVISGTVLASLKSSHLNARSINDLLKNYSHNVDFQRQLKSGDNITLLYEKFYTEDGKFLHTGKILFSSLSLSGKKYDMYAFNKDKANITYYSENAVPTTRNLLRTPVKVVRISSKFGSRKHPILGYTRMHKGVDFGAPVGTPIMSAGDGVITEMGWKGGYGNFIQIKHSTNLSTAYAHIKSFASGLKIGAKVKQGQVIGSVGLTGMTDGPHLHYEVKINNKHVNPLNVHTVASSALSGQQLNSFKQFKQECKKWLVHPDV